MALVTALLVRNEASSDRYLKRVLGRCLAFSDKVLVLDDRSTDDTAKIAKEMGCVVKSRSVLTARAWGTESAARKELWEFALEHCTTPNDWLLICDADMEMRGDPRELCRTTETNAWAVVLYDLWDSDTTYRSDQFWIGHTVPRVWLVAPRRVPKGWEADWSDRGIHIGHFPHNFPLVAGIAPTDTYYYLHLGWMKERHRKEKHSQYASQAHQLSPHEMAHVQSILSANP